MLAARECKRPERFNRAALDDASLDRRLIRQRGAYVDRPGKHLGLVHPSAAFVHACILDTIEPFIGPAIQTLGENARLHGIAGRLSETWPTTDEQPRRIVDLAFIIVVSESQL